MVEPNNQLQANQAYDFQSNTQSILAERAILVTVQQPEETSLEHQAVVREMINLAKTAGLETVDKFHQHIRQHNPKTLIGKGKVEEIKSRIELGGEIDPTRRGENNQAIDIVVFGSDLSPVQQRNLERDLGRRVIDRSELILDIFAQHAVTRDGKIQVELAQLQYLKPRLTGKGLALSRLGGGIGTRGPGETKLETDRRKIDGRIRKLKEEYEKCRSVGKVQRRNRKRGDAISVALVGYTNAGKSTVLNRLTKANVTAQDLLFCTLDTTTRRLFLPNGTRFLLSDTVGFIENLPELLLGAFRATLAEVEEADALIHVVDASDRDAERHIEAVADILTEMEVVDKPMLTILNKSDAVEDHNLLRTLQRQCNPSVTFSALHDKDLNDLFSAMIQLGETVREKKAAPVVEESWL